MKKASCTQTNLHCFIVEAEVGDLETSANHIYLKVKVCSSTSFLHHQSPHVSPAEVERHLAAQALQQVLRSILQVERALVLQHKHTFPHYNLSV